MYIVKYWPNMGRIAVNVTLVKHNTLNTIII